MTAPYVIEVKSDSNTGNYYTNTTISIKVIFNTIIEVNTTNGSPYLVLDVGNNNTHNATYDGLETTDPSIAPYNDTIVFSYTIQAAHVNTNLNYNDEDSLVLNNATIKDSTQNINANLKLPIPSTSPSEYFFGIPGDGSIDVSGNFGNFDAVFSTQTSNILLNNNSHESVGGQITTADGINFKNLTKSLGYKNYFKITKNSEIRKITNKFIKVKGPSFLEVKIMEGSMKNLVRPKNLISIKKSFMNKK